MGLYIEDLRMPKNCVECKLCDPNNPDECLIFAIKKADYPNERFYKCSLTEINVDHGRLVDANEVYARAEHEKEFIGDIKKDDFPMYVDWILSKSFTYINAEYNHI